MRRTSHSTVWPLLMALVVVFMAIAASPAQAVRKGGSMRRETWEYSTEWKAEQEADRIVALPGQPPVDFAMYAGYVTVNKEAGRAHYYYFVEAEEEPETKPLAFWFNGGPGCSSLSFGFAEELGPFNINPGGESLRLNPNAGNKLANILFLESPAGVGFSYTNTSNDILTTGDNRTAHDNYAFLSKWLERFPQYKGRPLYLTGESYAGFYVPELAKLILENNKKLSINDKINLKGLFLGNPLIERYYDVYLGFVDFLFYHSIISSQLYNQIKTVCNFTRENQTLSASCEELIYGASVVEAGNIDFYSVYAKSCTNLSGNARNLKCTNPVLGRRRFQKYDPCTVNYASIYFNRPEVQKAMHANTTGIPYPWAPCNDPLFYIWKDSPISMMPLYKELLEAGLRLWVFSGDADSVVPTIGTRYALDQMNLPIAVPWYPWYQKDQVGGREIVYERNLTLVTVRGAGHEVPLLKPRQFLHVFKAFLKGVLLPDKPYT